MLLVSPLVLSPKTAQGETDKSKPFSKAEEQLQDTEALRGIGEASFSKTQRTTPSEIEEAASSKGEGTTFSNKEKCFFLKLSEVLFQKLKNLGFPKLKKTTFSGTKEFSLLET